MIVCSRSDALEELITVTLRRSLYTNNKVSTFIGNIDCHCPYLGEREKMKIPDDSNICVDGDNIMQNR
jgi:hypothetical protein